MATFTLSLITHAFHDIFHLIYAVFNTLDTY